MAKRQLVSTGTIWEERVGFSRAVRVGDQVFVAGTTATDDDGTIVGIGDAATQTRFILRKITLALEQAGASTRDVVRYRCFVTNVDDWQAIGEALHEVFGDVRPASTLLEISRLVSPEQMVEIEVDAIIGSGD
jgi:enamine deaminase RidA (YjgF/YER057c/UK114 family)